MHNRIRDLRHGAGARRAPPAFALVTVVAPALDYEDTGRGHADFFRDYEIRMNTPSAQPATGY